MPELIDTNADGFYSHVDRQRPFVVAFVMRGCGWCDKLRPSLEQAARGSSVPYLCIERQQAGTLVNKLKIEGFPTLYVVKDGQMFPYKGARDAEALQRLGT